MSALSVIITLNFPRLLILATLVTLGVGCAGPKEIARPAPPPDPAAAARRLLDSGEYAAAGDAYAALTQSASAPNDRQFRGLAALAYQDAGDFARAEEILGPPAPEPDPAAATLARAHALLQADDATQAFTLANAIEVSSLTPYEVGVHARVVGAAALALQNYSVAATALVTAFMYPFPAQAAATLVPAAWQAISRLPQAELEKQINASNAVTAGWYALGLLNARSLADATAFGLQLEEWRTRYPQHPATGLLEEIAKRAVAGMQPKKVALLLPFDVTLAAAAIAIRDGFLTAWFMDGRNSARPQVQIYSTTGVDILQLYQRAVGDGAELIIGPLSKDLVERLVSVAELPVAVLALNVRDPKPGAAPPLPSFFQFGLTPESEAAQVARHARARGSRAIVIAPSNTWGGRLMNAYSTAWKQHGGIVLSEVSYHETAASYASTIKRALNIDLSEARAAGLRATLGLPLHSSTRLRADADTVLLAAYPNNARQLLPQMRYFGADRMPVFATSHVYAGLSDAGRDIDLDGLTFGDMPWLFGTSDIESFNLVRRNWPALAGSFARLYAFGVDAYRMIPYLVKMRQQTSLRVPGVTGDLWMELDGVVQRNLVWMKFMNGVPTAVDQIFPVGDVPAR